VSGLLAALWLLGLFAAAPALRVGKRSGFADRLRDALILGVAIPFALGLIHALYPAACWVALAICLAAATLRRRFANTSVSARPETPVPYVLIGALAAVAWPQLMRPLLDGDSLSYHLPNAASWAQAHSLWTTSTNYWWYPPASELFASALYCVGSPFALPWSGVGALALIGFRIAAWARDAFAAPPLLADALAAATVTAYPLAIQGATLQNDAWLAAFWLESLWTMRSGLNAAASRALAVCALIKPQGWLLAAIALVARRAPGRLWLAAAAPLAVWVLRDLLLWRGAAIPSASTMEGNVFGSTILAHGAPALVTLIRVGLAASPFALLALCASIAGPAIGRRDSRLGWAAFTAAVLFFVLPFGYATSVAQLATGASLRFAAPAIAAGAIAIAFPARRLAGVATTLLLASTVFGVWYVLGIFWNDGGTHVALVVAALAVGVAAAAHLARVAWPNALAFGMAVVAAAHLAARHPIDYYADSLRVAGVRPGVYRWIVSARPPALGGWGLRLGVVNVLSPTTRTLDLPDAAPCAQARRYGVLLVAVAQSDRSASANAERLSAARACGDQLYGDAAGVAVLPRRTLGP
jgi:hypothetical protein